MQEVGAMADARVDRRTAVDEDVVADARPVLAVLELHHDQTTHWLACEYTKQSTRNAEAILTGSSTIIVMKLCQYHVVR